MQKVPFGQLGYVNEPFQSLFNASEGAEIHHVGDRPLHNLPDLSAARLSARIGMQAFQAERDAAFAGDRRSSRTP